MNAPRSGCPINLTLEALGDRWSLIVIRDPVTRQPFPGNVIPSRLLDPNGRTLIDDYGWRTPLLGTLVAFATAVVAVRWLVAYLRTRPLSHFGWYRLAVAAVTVALIWQGSV